MTLESILLEEKYCFLHSGLTSFLVSTDAGTYPVSISVTVPGVTVRRSNDQWKGARVSPLVGTLKVQVETQPSSKVGDGFTYIDAWKCGFLNNKLLLLNYGSLPIKKQ